MALPAIIGLDLTKVQEQIERHLARGSKIIDRGTQLAVAPEARAHSRKHGGDGAWAHRAMPSDPPVIQMILYLSDQLETGPWQKIEDDFKRCQMQNQITKQIADLLSTLEDKSSAAFDELCTLINQHMRKTEHDQKMDLATKRDGGPEADAKLVADCRAEGILVPGATDA